MLDYRYRTILAVALPLMASSFIQSIVMITDGSFLSRYNTIAFDAAGNAGLLYVTLFIAMNGISDGAQILISRRIGQERQDLIARIFGTTLFTNLIIAILLFTLVQLLAPSLIQWYTHNPLIAQGQIEFINIRSYGLFFAVVNLAINAYMVSNGRTTIVLFGALITAVSNIFLDYSLIFGKCGFPELGLTGAGLASSAAEGVTMFFLLFILIRSKKAKKHRLFSQMRFNATSFKELMKLGLPITLQGLAALITWTVFFIWIEQMGTHELTISQNIRGLYFLAFVPIWGFASTTKTYISQYIGNKEFDKLKLIIRRIQLLTVVFLVIFFHGAILYPETLIKLINPDLKFVKESAEILTFVAGSVIIYGLGSVYFQTISGSGNTRFTFYVELLSVMIYLIAAYILIKILDLTIYWVWSVEYIYFICMGGLSLGYLKLFDWKNKEI